MKYKLKLEGQEYEVEVEEVGHQAFRVTVDGEELEVRQDGESGADAVPSGTPGTGSVSGETQAQKAASAPPRAASGGKPRAPSQSAGAVGDSKSVLAPMPGTLLRVLVSEGDQVSVGDVVAILEAMKMENELRAKAEGTVGRVATGGGQYVSKGDLVVEVI